MGPKQCNVVVDSNIQVGVVLSKSLRVSNSYKFKQQLSQFYNFIKSSQVQLKYF